MLQNINIITNRMFLIFLVNVMCEFFCTFAYEIKKQQTP